MERVQQAHHERRRLQRAGDSSHPNFVQRQVMPAIGRPSGGGAPWPAPSLRLRASSGCVPGPCVYSPHARREPWGRGGRVQRARLHACCTCTQIPLNQELRWRFIELRWRFPLHVHQQFQLHACMHGQVRRLHVPTPALRTGGQPRTGRVFLEAM